MVDLVLEILVHAADQITDIIEQGQVRRLLRTIVTGTWFNSWIVGLIRIGLIPAPARGRRGWRGRGISGGVCRRLLTGA
jgi:hypothetical protein